MQDSTNAKVEKVGKGVIKISFPTGTTGEILESVPVRELLDVLEGRTNVGNQSTFPLNAPVPV